jgi:hypothetical protein
MKRPLLSLLPLVITACGGEVTTPPPPSLQPSPSPTAPAAQPTACERAQVAVPVGQTRALPLGCTITTLGDTLELAVEAGQYYRLHAAVPEGVGVVIIIDGAMATSNRGPWPAPPDVRWVASQTAVLSAHVIVVAAPPELTPFPLTLEALAPIADDHANTLADAGTLGVDAPITGAIDYPGDPDVFRLSVREGVIYELSVAPEDDMLLPIIELLQPDGGVLGWDFRGLGGEAAVVLWRAQATGELLVRVRSAVSTTGRYRLRATEPSEDLGPNDAAQARPLVALDVVEDLITAGDEDWFTVQLAPGQRLTVTLTSPHGVHLELQAPARNSAAGTRGRGVNGSSIIDGYAEIRDGGEVRLRVTFDERGSGPEVRRYRLSIDNIE